MKIERSQKYRGERALFRSEDLLLENCLFYDGESPLKESNNIELNSCMFKWKYPLWYAKEIKMSNCTLFSDARAGIWYTKDISIEDTVIEAPKTFRRAQNINLKNVNLTNAQETLWQCSDITLDNVTARGDYFAMNCSNMTIENFNLVGNYSFDGVKNVVIKNAKILSKDAFWNSENVTVIDSIIVGEYLGWNASNLTLINCTVESLQGLCYIENLKMENCHMINTTLAFEYSTVDVDVDEVDSIINPSSGKINATSIGEIIFDEKLVDKNKTVIKIKDAGKEQ